jgi:protein-disulfide isomerase
MGLGLFNFAVYGNCNGPNSDEFCIYDPLGTNKPQPTATQGEICSIPGQSTSKILTAPKIKDLEHIGYQGNPNAKVVIIEFGCYSCHYTKQAEPTIKKIVDKYGDQILYIYKDFPLSLTHENAIKAAQAAHCALDQGKYWEYREYLFANQQQQFEEALMKYANDLQLDTVKFKQCLDSDKFKSLIEQNYDEGISSGISVTPTFFINNETIVGAKDYSEFNKIVRKELGISWFEFWK